MFPASAQLKGWNVDALAASADGGLLVAGLSNFIGRHWTGAVAVLAVDAAGSTLKLRELKELRAGVPAIALLPAADQFTGGWGWSLLVGGSMAGAGAFPCPCVCSGRRFPTQALASQHLSTLCHVMARQHPAGRRVVASGDDSGSVDLWYLSGGGDGALLEHAQVRGRVRFIARGGCSSSMLSGPVVPVWWRRWRPAGACPGVRNRCQVAVPGSFPCRGAAARAAFPSACICGHLQLFLHLCLQLFCALK